MNTLTTPPPAQHRLRVLSNHLTRHPTSEGYLGAAYNSLFGVCPESALHSGHLVSSVLKAHGVQHIFCLSGGHISPILVASEKDDIRIIDVRHEVNAVFAADAMARLTGIPGVAAVTAGPGVTNTITAIKNAQMAQVPLVLLGGAAATIMKGRGSLQDIDQRSVLEPIVKRCFTISTVRDIVPMLREAFQCASSGVPGPVFVELPLDVLYCPLDIMVEMGWFERTRRGRLTDKNKKQVVVPEEALNQGLDRDQYLDTLRLDSTVFLRKTTPNANPLYVQAYLGIKLKYVHGNTPVMDLKAVDCTPLPVHLPLPQVKEINQTKELLRTARRPVLVLGSQVTIDARLMMQLVAAVNVLGIPTFLGGMARGLLGRHGRNFIRQGRTQALAESDCVILCGAVTDFRLGYGKSLPKHVPIVAVNRSVEMLNLNTDLYWTPTLASHSDPCHFLIQLGQAWSNDGGDEDGGKGKGIGIGQGTGGGETSGKGKTASAMDPNWLPSLKAKEQAKEKINALKCHEKAYGTGDQDGKELVNPLRLFHELEATLPDNSILVADGGDFVATAAYTLRPRGPLSWLDPGAYGTLGVGGGFALAAGLLHPDKEIWIIWGDGSAGYSIAEFDTYARHGVNVIGLVGNDACWTQIEREQTPMFGSSAATMLSYRAYDQVAVGYGAEGILVDDPNTDLQHVFQQARQHRQNNRPVLINVHIGKTDFREGSISV
jgi:acetolactate synthase-like protein